MFLAGLMGCDRVFDLERERPCGDGDLALSEDCDDGGNTSGDGCSESCVREPGFVCPFENAGSPCLPVLGFARGTVTSMLPAGGMLGSGNPFTYDCPDGAVVLGFQGYANLSDDNLGKINVVCGTLGVGAAGAAQAMRTGESGFIGDFQRDPLLTVTCDPDEVVVGFLPLTNTYIAGFDVTCQKLSHTDGAMRFGASRSLSFVTPAPKPQREPARSCPPNQVVSGVFGGKGIAIDHLGMTCSEIAAVVCGDGIVATPETCDDGNLVPHDGCDERCVRE